MKKFLVSGIATATLLVTMCTPAFANVVRPAGQTSGKPVAAQSNTGSTQGQTSMSSTGSSHKLMDDRYLMIY